MDIFDTLDGGTAQADANLDETGPCGGYNG